MGFISEFPKLLINRVFNAAVGSFRCSETTVAVDRRSEFRLVVAKVALGDRAHHRDTFPRHRGYAAAKMVTDALNDARQNVRFKSVSTSLSP